MRSWSMQECMQLKPTAWKRYGLKRKRKSRRPSRQYLYMCQRASQQKISTQLGRISNSNKATNAAYPQKTSPTISSIPFIPLSTSAEGSEIQSSDRLTGHEGEPIILAKVARSTKRAKDNLIDRLLGKSYMKRDYREAALTITVFL